MPLRRWVVGALVVALAGSVLVFVRAQSEAAEAGGPLRDLTSGESDTLYAAEDVLLAECMRRRGFSYEPQRLDPGPQRWNLPYVVDDVQWARSRGLGLTDPAQVSAARRANPNERYLQSLPDDQRQAYSTSMFGAAPLGMAVRVPTGVTVTQNPSSCRSKAQDELYGDVRVWFPARAVVENLPARYLPQVHDDPRFIAAQRAWSACVREVGYDVTSPAELRAAIDPPAEDQLDPSPGEVAAAVAEATCAQQTGFGAIARAVQDERRAEVRREFQSDVDTYRRLRLAALPRATKIVAALGS